MSNIFTKAWRFVLLRRPGDMPKIGAKPVVSCFPRQPMHFLALKTACQLLAKGQKFHDTTMMVSVIGEKMIDKRINAIARILSV